MSFQLDTSSFGFDIKKAHAQVLNGSPDCSWAVFGYAKGQGNTLKVIATGNDDYEFLDEFDENAVLFGFLRVKDTNTGLHKFVLVSWCGEAAPSSRKGLFPIHSSSVTRLLNGYHIQITGRESSDLNLDDIVHRVADASGSKYSSNTSLSPTPSAASKPVNVPSSAPAPASSRSQASSPGSLSATMPPQKPTPEDYRWNDTYTQRPSRQSSLRIPVNASWPTAPTSAAQQDPEKEGHTDLSAAAPVHPISLPKPDASHTVPSRPISSQPMPSSSTATPAKEESNPSISETFAESTKSPASELEQLHASGNVNLSARRAMFERFQQDNKPSTGPQTKSQPTKLRHNFESAAASKAQNPDFKHGPKVDAFANNKNDEPKEPTTNPPSVASLRSRFASQNSNNESNSTATTDVQSSKNVPSVGNPPSAPESMPVPANAAPMMQAPSAPTMPPRPESTKKVQSHPGASYAPSPPPPQRQQEVQTQDLPPAPPVPPVPEQTATPSAEANLQTSSPTPPAMPAKSDEEAETDTTIPPLPPVVETPPPQPPLPPTPEIKTRENEDGLSIAPESSSKTPALVIYDYSPEEENELELTEGEKIQILDFVDEGWWFGENSNGKQGLFPSNYVELLQEEKIAPAQAPESNVEDGSGQTSVKAIYDYQAQEDNELSFYENDFITNVDQIDPNWWEGECHGRRGLFPSNYVEEI
ncbi:App1 protein [Schizosaccharomyces cryophilus OY26]|uniref:App1 protein n=1 Tax=Schizosaccharomyces cryophilus (strain OY26 / ATCC MYA-4695 / CBS 11777 / NBRC 106824 / NRRL Y48691) TaxID=653667 RepID=S9VQE0_SCHCR|nr:App1 protein [Schizosaccharomyces cryophilus OY26]EPY50183.1 App1 protein [Schizosaccharomyces cryophilus OY26]